MNYYGSITTFLRSCGIDHKSLVAKQHRPHKEDPDPEAYTEDEINAFLVACNSERDRLFFEFLLKTGAREKEATHAERTDINWTENAITVYGEKNVKVVVGGKEKKLRFRTKTRRSRDTELYNPATGTWTATGCMSTVRAGQTSTVLTNGHVVNTGGSDAFNELDSAELYTP